MRVIAYGVLGVGLLVCPGLAQAKKCTDDAAVAAARSTAEEQCDCAGATNHGQYVKCVNEVAKTLASTGALPQECKGEVTRCAAKSTCGKPGFVTCCRIDRRGKVKCSIKRGADRCRPPRDGQACVGSAASCCDACQPTSPGGSFVCEETTTTTAAPTTTTAAPTTTTAAPTTTTAAPTTTTAAPTTTTAAPTTTTAPPTTTTLPGSPSGAFFDGTP